MVVGYYNRLEANKYIAANQADCIYIKYLIDSGMDRIEVIKLIRTDPRLSLFDCVNLYAVLKGVK